MRAFGFKVGKSANMTPKKIFESNFYMGIKNIEFDADFKAVEKVVKKFLQKIVGNVYFFTFLYCVQKFSASDFIRVIFSATFLTNLESASISAFLIPISKF
jgi:hypothetical protein